jgi:hypothetical protein
MTTPDTPTPGEEETHPSLAQMFACRCDPAWTERNLHAPECIEELGTEVQEILDAATAALRTQLAEARAQLAGVVEEAKRAQDLCEQALNQRDAARPVVEAAEAWAAQFSGPTGLPRHDALVAAVDTYRKDKGQ